MESKLEDILRMLAEGQVWRDAMQERLGKLESGPPPAGSSSGPINQGPAGVKQEHSQVPSDTAEDNPKSPNPPDRERGTKDKGKKAATVPPSYSRQDDPFAPEEDENEEPGDQLFPQRDGGLTPYDPVLPADYEDLAKRVHGVRLDPDCVWRKANGFKGEHAKEVAALKKVFLCLEVSLKALSAYETLEEEGSEVSLESIVYDLRTSTLAAMYSILNRRKFLYSLSTTSEDVAKIFNSVRGNGGELSREEQEDLLFAAKMAREQKKSRFDAPRPGSNSRGRGEKRGGGGGVPR